MNDAKELAAKGRFGDTILAHINPQEAQMLKAAGGSGTINPATGLPEFHSQKFKAAQALAGYQAALNSPDQTYNGIPLSSWLATYNYHNGKPDNGGLGGLLKQAAGVVLPIAGSFFGPLGAAIGGAAGSAINGGSIGQDLLAGGLGGLAAELAPAAGNAFSNAFPETAQALGIGGGANTLTDLLGQTTGGGSWSGPGTLGGGLSSLFGSGAPSIGSGLTPDFASGVGTPNTDLSATGFGGQPTNDLFTNAARADTSAAAALPSPNLSTQAPSVGLPSVGGGTPGGFVSDTPFGSDLTSQFAQGLSNPDASAAIGSNVPTGASFSPTLSAGESSVQSPNILQSLLGGGTSAGGQLVNGLLRGGASMLMSNNNNKGYDAKINAAGQIQKDYLPFMQAGMTANNTLSSLLGAQGGAAQTTAQNNFRNTPGYQFALNQGIAAQDASAAAKGQLLSGNQQKALTDYGQGLADTTYNQYVQNLQNQVGTGLGAAGGVATGQAGVGNAQAGKSGAAANSQNTGLAAILGGLFPQPGISFGSNGINVNNGNNGLLSLLFGGGQPAY